MTIRGRIAAMDVKVSPGKYVVAVSGGVDSVCLLNMLSNVKLDLIVAHFDHGIRKDSSEDRKFVEGLAKKYGLPFEYAEGRLGVGASEATAREARYAFLRKMKDKYGSKAIITAHHQDDLIETAIINLLRGTGRKGLTALDSKGDIVRPLLGFSKQQLLDYAAARTLEWREDPTNNDTGYLRNYVRHELLPKFDTAARRKLVSIINSQRLVNAELDRLLSGVEGQLDRAWFVSLPHDAAREIMAVWLRANGLGEFDKPAIERTVVGAKTARPGKKIEVKKDVKIEVGKTTLALTHPER